MRSAHLSVTFCFDDLPGKKIGDERRRFRGTAVDCKRGKQRSIRNSRVEVVRDVHSYNHHEGKHEFDGTPSFPPNSATVVPFIGYPDVHQPRKHLHMAMNEKMAEMVPTMKAHVYWVQGKFGTRDQ